VGEPNSAYSVSSLANAADLRLARPNTTTLEPNVKKTTAVLATLAIGAAAIGISIAPSAAADPQCQDIGATTVCAQGTVGPGDPSADSTVGPGDPSADSTAGPLGDPNTNGCLTPYGTYQRC
jgi:hypothetical protein